MAEEVNGIINVYKEAGFTSHDVVAKLRGILHQKKIGHTGTLDPAATGVLPVCCGKAVSYTHLDVYKRQVLDVTGKKNGRGAYLCDSISCLSKARKKKAIDRALNMTIPEDVYQQLEKEMMNHAD